MTLNIGYLKSTLLLLSVFVATLILQLRSKAFHPALFWLVILSTSTAGTTLSDYMDRSLELGYATGSLILVAGLAIVLTVWRLTEKSLSVSNISSTRGESLYWAAILFSNTLGTALGDYLADDSGLGFLGGAMLIGGMIAGVVLLNFYTRINKILLFWVAFVLTRPFGATFGDLLTKPIDKGGLDFGTVGSSLILASVLFALVVYSVIVAKPKTLSASAQI